jgi:hypothetical protein
VVVVDAGVVVQLNRYNYDTLRAYTPGDYRAPTADLQLPDRSNPSDTAFCGGLAFTALYDADHLVVHDPDGWVEVGQVALDAFADGDGVGPEAASVMAWDGSLYVAMQRRKRHEDWAPAQGAIARVDCASLTVVERWPLGTNLRLAADADGAPVAFGAPFEAEAGGLWRLVPEPTRLYTSAGPVLDGVAIVGGTAVVSAHDADTWAATLGCVDLASGAFTLGEATEAFVVSVQPDPIGRAWVLKRSGWLDPDANPAEIGLWDPGSCTETASLATSLEPFSVGFVP